MSKRKHGARRKARTPGDDKLKKFNREVCSTFHGKGATFKEARNGCIGKARYVEKSYAKKVAKRLNLKIYLCPFCGGWHLTSQGRNEDGTDD